MLRKYTSREMVEVSEKIVEQFGSLLHVSVASSKSEAYVADGCPRSAEAYSNGGEQ
jgi:hypothetical protein